MLSGLRTLILVGVEPLLPSVEELVSILGASPALVNLKLASFECGAPNGDFALHARPVEVLHLGTLMLFRLPLIATQSLLRLLRVPAYTLLELSVQSETPSDLFDASMDHITAVMCNILASKDKESRSYVVVLGAPGSTLVKRLVKAFELQRAVELEGLLFDWSSAEPIQSLIQPVLHSSLRSQYLTIRDWNPVEGAPRCLEEPITVDGTTLWPLPALTTIELVRSRPKTDVLIDMIKRRYKLDTNLGGSDVGLRSVERPVALETFAIDTPFDAADAAEVDRLKSMLGEGVLKWECSKE
ncbi:hypothetical protein FRB96_007242 [Tulasnella sp. 330]|nr:hypothetical protein FRB96_007242 [Tulasnella sp. 330]